MATRLYNHLKEEGPKTTAQIKDWLNNDFRPKSEGNASNKFKFTVTSEQISGLMRTSPLFECIGDDKMIGENGKFYVAKVYQIVPVETVVNKMLDADGQLKKHRLRKRLPSIIREEIKSRGLLL
tara:strand:- start:1732 stop:2103 length:372 start_codon:yes stop_codon:yes gene_type:complete